jgi:hypothetical protein
MRPQEIIVFAYATFVACLLFWLFFKTCDGFNTFIWRLLGRKIVVIEGVTSAVRGKTWRSPLLVSPVLGTLTAWRYPATETGSVKLNPDGTGEYCGQIVWKYA